MVICSAVVLMNPFFPAVYNVCIVWRGLTDYYACGVYPGVTSLRLSVVLQQLVCLFVTLNIAPLSQQDKISTLAIFQFWGLCPPVHPKIRGLDPTPRALPRPACNTANVVGGANSPQRKNILSRKSDLTLLRRDLPICLCQLWRRCTNTSVKIGMREQIHMKKSVAEAPLPLFHVRREVYQPRPHDFAHCDGITRAEWR